MAYVFDASALVKRYIPLERGASQVAQLFGEDRERKVPFITFLEVISTFYRLQVAERRLDETDVRRLRGRLARDAVTGALQIANDEEAETLLEIIDENADESFFALRDRWRLRCRPGRRPDVPDCLVLMIAQTLQEAGDEVELVTADRSQARLARQAGIVVKEL